MDKKLHDRIESALADTMQQFDAELQSIDADDSTCPHCGRQDDGMDVIATRYLTKTTLRLYVRCLMCDAVYMQDAAGD